MSSHYMANVHGARPTGALALTAADLIKGVHESSAVTYTSATSGGSVPPFARSFLRTDDARTHPAGGPPGGQPLAQVVDWGLSHDQVNGKVWRILVRNFGSRGSPRAPTMLNRTPTPFAIITARTAWPRQRSAPGSPLGRYAEVAVRSSVDLHSFAVTTMRSWFI
jgi:hypothetical protein